MSEKAQTSQNFLLTAIQLKYAMSASTICKELSNDLTKETYQNHLNQTLKCKCICIYIYIYIKNFGHTIQIHI